MFEIAIALRLNLLSNNRLIGSLLLIVKDDTVMGFSGIDKIPTFKFYMSCSFIASVCARVCGPDLHEHDADMCFHSFTNYVPENTCL